MGGLRSDGVEETMGPPCIGGVPGSERGEAGRYYPHRVATPIRICRILSLPSKYERNPGGSIILTLWSVSPRWGGSPCDCSSSAGSSFFRWHVGLRCFRSASCKPCREGTWELTSIRSHSLWLCFFSHSLAGGRF